MALNYRERQLRRPAWQNLMVAAINAALEQQLLTLEPGDNRWPFGRDCIYRFEFNGAPALGRLQSLGPDEVQVKAVYLPTPDAEQFLRVIRAVFRAGEAVAGGTLIRRAERYLRILDQFEFHCRPNRLEELVQVEIAPAGYGIIRRDG